MIYSDVTITVKGNTATLDNDLFLYKNDKNITINISIVNSIWNFAKKLENNIIEKTEATFFTLRWMKGDKVKKVFEEQQIKKGKCEFVITEELIDEDIEMGDYDFQISLLDEEKNSILSIPPVIEQIHINKHIFEDEDINTVGNAKVGIAKVGTYEQRSTENSEGLYNKKTWQDNEVITKEDLNTIEEGIYNNSTQCKEIANKIDEISNPFNINSFTVSPSTAQKGSTINVTVKWSYNKDINSQTLNNATLDVTLREKTFSSVNADVTYTLNATSTNNISKAKSETVKFYNGIYYGKSSSTTYDSALINSLTKVLSDSKARTITVNAGTREYIYYCLPSRLGTPNFNVGGFDGGFDKVETVSFTNSDGYTENYDIYKSNNANLGNTTIVIK